RYTEDEYEDESSILFVIKNAEGSSDLGDEPECRNSDDELEDSSLKEINTKQTFTSFKMLEQYLKHYFT
ncbi:9999_t:CDS:2, partial [Racocetra fulgida]